MWASGTTFIVFEDVKVPVENLIGKEGKGFNYIMVNVINFLFLYCLNFFRKNKNTIVNNKLRNEYSNKLF